MSQDTKPLGHDADDFADDPVGLTRRRFIKGLCASAGVIAAGMLPALVTQFPQAASAAEGAASAKAGAALSESNVAISHIIEEDGAINYPGHPVFYADEPGDQKWAMVIDVKACIGCRRCVYACVKENNIGRNSGFTYIQVLEMEQGAIEVESATDSYEQGGNPEKWYMPVQCMQCAKPTCVYGCPVKATWKEPDGIVVIDYNKCISCRNCMVTCPYFARHFNWVEPHVPKNEINPKVPLEAKHGVVEKCTFCIQRTRNGQTTACTEACPVGARKFGDLNDPNSEVATLLKTRRVFRFKEELGTEPMIWYVG
ncbi:MAG: 4Fe-4S dicluster domain-containing protein [Actinobacteria bacterium]|nr:MAG: 4Fe-4S dicluster domain-containing protein [Actinomycetota bacterium]